MEKLNPCTEIFNLYYTDMVEQVMLAVNSSGWIQTKEVMMITTVRLGSHRGF